MMKARLDRRGIFVKLAGLLSPERPPVDHEMSRILAQLQRFRDAKPGPFWATIGLAGVSVFGMVAAFGTASSALELQTVPQQTVVEQLAIEPIAAALLSEASPETPATFVREERIGRGDTVASLLNRLGVQDDAAFAFLLQAREAQAIFRQLRPGKVMTARVGDNGSLQELIFPLNSNKDIDRVLLVQRKGDSFTALEQNQHLETQTEIKSGEISYSLFGATDAAGIPDGIATQIADIFGGDIDFHRDLRKGDRFSLTYETLMHLGRPVRSGRILAAEFVNAGKTYRAIWFQGGGGQGGYYTADGKNMRKAFLRSPLEFSRVTSGFTMSRFHPILQKWRAHTGVDYGAPTGTRVKATGDGVVEFAGSQGGYGRVIILRHQGSYTTVYGHLAAFATGTKKGARVSQGDVIGYVGATGLATGPHLHYEFRVNNVFRNPLTIALPGAPPLPANQQSRFGEYAREVMARLGTIRGNNVALLD
jgi:murein DD-endopeptidase MepM/ murein hydrolase activator NlpD